MINKYLTPSSGVYGKTSVARNSSQAVRSDSLLTMIHEVSQYRRAGTAVVQYCVVLFVLHSNVQWYSTGGPVQWYSSAVVQGYHTAGTVGILYYRWRVTGTEIPVLETPLPNNVPPLIMYPL